MIHVFTGPTLSPDDPALRHRYLRVRPPIRHGDLFDPQVTADDTVVIIDGVYHHSPAVRHKELVWTLGRGVCVVGAASIGALRAAELHAFGMIGVGAVWHAYVEGRLDGDDEVAVAQSTDDARACTWPLVRVRQVAGIARTEGVIDADQETQIIDALAGVYYAHRSLDAVKRLGQRVAPEFIHWLTRALAVDAYFGDVKRADALDAIALAQELAGSPAEVVPGLTWTTRCFRQWANAFAFQDTKQGRLPTVQRVNFQQIFDRQFKEVWWEFLTSHGVPELPPTLMCAVINPRADLTDETTTARLLARETAADRADVARYAAITDEACRSNRGFFPEAIKESVVREMLAGVWCVSPAGLEEEAWLRGFQGAKEAVAAARPFVLGFLRDQGVPR
ncbi:TfuA-like protein [Streptomyces flaveolus]|uniref:TfuA-like protein n=1 Tax=Streptomyces flaveolus TaxID=67297 RepID=A0ABV1VQG5_9ACTN